MSLPFPFRSKAAPAPPLGRGRKCFPVLSFGTGGAAAAIFLLFASLLNFSCASKLAPDTYYRLTADGPAPALKTESPEIGVGPIDLADYIDRYEMVFQSSPNRFEIPSNHRWTGSLQNNISSVLTTNLARRLKPRGVASYPYPNGINPAVKVAVQIHRLHALTGEDAVLEASWFIMGKESGTITRTATYRQDLIVDGYEGVAEAESQLLSTLAAAIAKDL